MSRLIGWLGVVCLIVVVLTHIAERFYLLPGMGWGLPGSPGHYLDLFSATSGGVLLLVAFVLLAIERWNGWNRGTGSPF